MRRHFQTPQVRAAERALRGPAALPWSGTLALVARVCGRHGIPLPPVVAGDHLRVAPDGITLPKRSRPVTVLHAMAHVLTDPHFPPHGAEFARCWLELAEQYTPRTAAPLAEEFLSRQLHSTPAARRDVTHRTAVYFVNNLPDIEVELTLDDPPVCKGGPLESYSGGVLVVGGESFPLERARYLYRAERAW